MFNKMYVKLKNYIIENHNFLLFLILLVIVLNIRTPYVINAPGGIIPLSDRVTINNKSIKSNYYTTYVKVMDGKVVGVLASFILPNWDLEKYEEYSGHTGLSYNELTKVERLMMKEGHNKAILLALDKANVSYEKTNNKLVVYYKIKNYDNDLKIGDVINKCNGEKINSVDDLHKCVKNNISDVTLEIERDNNTKEIKVPIYNKNGEKLIGISLINDFEIQSDYDIQINSLKSESGSSGSFMTALSIYDYITNLNISNKYKIAGTGTIKDDGKIGIISGIKYKLLGSEKKHVDIFFVPKDNYKEALKIKKKHKLKLKLIKVETIDDAINYLNKLKK